MIFLDTNIVVYAAAARLTAPRKWKIATDLMASADFALSAQVMAEFVNVVRRRLDPPMPEPLIADWLSRLARRPLAPVDGALVMRGREISERHVLNYYDGAIIAAAERLGCDTVVSEDLSDGQRYGAVTVRNPFKEA